MLQSLDDPGISSEAQQVIDRLRTLLSQLEKDLEENGYTLCDLFDTCQLS